MFIQTKKDNSKRRNGLNKLEVVKIKIKLKVSTLENSEGGGSIRIERNKKS